MSQQEHFDIAILWRSLGPYHLARAAAAAEALTAIGGRVTVIELCDSEETRDWAELRKDRPFAISTLSPGQKLTASTPDLSNRLVSVLNEIGPSHIAIAGYDRPEMRTALQWTKKSGANAILMSETKWDDNARPWWKRWILSRIVRQFDAGLVSGGAAGEYLISLGMPRERVFRQYGAVDNAFFQRHSDSYRSARPWPPHGEESYFIACCRIIEERKNLCGLLDAYQIYREQVEFPWRLVICGDGQDRSLVEKKIREDRIEAVELVGFKQARELADLYAGASCFVHTAFREAWGLVVNEAMAAGLPVLVSRRCGCMYDLVHEGINGYSFDPYESSELAFLMRQVSQLSDNQRTEMGQASQRIVGRFGVENFAAGLLNATGHWTAATSYGRSKTKEAETV
ncbi:glycosyltransferase family 4 protein [Blastopirellula marina]|uniref:Hexosyltransferase n=1 Tax=Blastopirellula marina TaxID=124 RepID=A0A2S8G0U5_9BACT|nr:glycosyltransferase family 4 protein [Blastopirellula marina]PQO38068.1 hexosyltransferase [Blastopirellula marina]PTL44724.1 hexosyltransferase [Blastopirellula marina]